VKTSQPPSENGGGILADEMGLGKTLTVISAIIRTAGDAKSFAERKEGTPENPDTSQHLASRSTLVVCPSLRELLSAITVLLACNS
jgi:SNF2 family DNA or RNA helicase